MVALFFFFLDVIQLLSPVCTYFTLLALRQKSHAVLIDEIAVSDSGKSIRRDLKRLVKRSSCFIHHHVR